MRRHPKIEVTSDGAVRLGFGDYAEAEQQEFAVAALSGDGRRVLTVHAVGTAKIHDAVTGAKLAEIRPQSPLEGSTAGPTGAPFTVFIESAALDHAGTVALLGLNDGTAGLFRVADGERLATLHPPGAPPATGWCVIRAVAFAADDSLALVGFPGRAVGVSSGRGERLVAFLTTADGERLVDVPSVRDVLVSSVAVSADLRRVFGGCADMTATVWDLATGEPVLVAREHAESTVAVFASDDGAGWLTTGGSVWFARPGEPARKLFTSNENWQEAKFHRGRLLTRSFDDSVALWTLAGEHTSLYRPTGDIPAGWSARASALAFHGDDALLYPEGGRRILVARGGRTTAIARADRTVTARFSPTGDAVAIAGWRDCVELWSLPDGALLREFASPGGIGDFAFSADGSRIAIGELGHGGGRYPRRVYVRETATGRELLDHGDHDFQIAMVRFSPDGCQLASLADELLVRDLQATTDPIVARIAVDRVTTDLCYLSDGRLLVLDRDRVRVFRGGAQVLDFAAPVGYETRWCVGDGGRTLVIAVDQGIARFDLETGELRDCPVAAIARPLRVLPRALARAAGIRTGATIWRVAGASFLHQGDGPRGLIEALCLSSQNVLVVPANDGAAVVALDPEPTLLGMVAFTGRLRASRVVDGQVVLVNAAGEVFRGALPGRTSQG